MAKVKFLRDENYSIDLKPVKYLKDEVHDLRDDLADRWKRRGAAVDYVEPVKDLPKPKSVAHEPAAKAVKPSGD